ncbi:hypothetical protein [Aliarcobacter butzleri]|uniref:Uncharacterized protein n=2 Tax=Aliarcobacter butzleri TaxID=28197 RepID=A0A837JD63_9BACT|nr:hypothetical protein [Aliarcobacter butzleri]KLE06250.1 hypothetical protein AF77_02510 [Aliarcobacter butzleri L352]MBF7071173.1 hypothetical protein [Aliarcobacter butzleri]MCG3701912.1 hypothetical protein [Aliarcobacter butzleri]MDN5052823.1 hypothetical protein [Aliarcobacter butzleri]MDN5075736.1 hypothetical protein [Aliarcobacter butzleri]
MNEFSLYMFFLGLFLVFLHIYEGLDGFFNEDRYIAKKSSEEVLQERLKMNEEGKLNKLYQFDLYYRIFLSKKLYLKIGVILICTGLILNIVF